ncbi:AmmeMemoRadiSam system protein B [Desulforhopalus singaporensis]|uniref:MEMO1 family protein SAMN05660330_01562 n=1 Tax=Desulforhopalus singaporensis TaxID=91360 RepID=A0A1H0P430_9BACT|nr:AmmeMemoRadiSam system protein B [Desulforhopalus singaporensis]SDO99488.1 hypothetical protein SAMN05660330_01562 [Desulforhopalus singaporensis]
MRQPIVAGRFYPGSPQALSQTLQDLFPTEKQEKTAARGVVSPHAGYVFSGGVAAKTLSMIDIPETVLVIGPNHHGRGAAVALSGEDWNMVTGIVPNASGLTAALNSHCDLIQTDELAHRDEHSLEVQLPFLQALQKNLTFSAMVVSRLSYQQCTEVGEAIARAITEYGKKVLIVASSDMNHYESRSVSRKKDQKALDAIMALDSEELYRTVFANSISMCGVIPVVITMVATRILGTDRATLVEYTDSGAVSGDTDQVVGYAGIIMH